MMLGFTWRMALAAVPSAVSKSVPPSSTVGFVPLVEASMSWGEEAKLNGKEFANAAVTAGVDGHFPSELSCSMSKGEESCRREANLADIATCWSDIWMPYREVERLMLCSGCEYTD